MIIHARPRFLPGLLVQEVRPERAAKRNKLLKEFDRLVKNTRSSDVREDQDIISREIRRVRHGRSKVYVVFHIFLIEPMGAVYAKTTISYLPKRLR